MRLIDADDKEGLAAANRESMDRFAARVVQRSEQVKSKEMKNDD